LWAKHLIIGQFYFNTAGVVEQGFGNSSLNKFMEFNQSSSYNNMNEKHNNPPFSGEPGFEGPLHNDSNAPAYSPAASYGESESPFQNVSNFERGISIGVGALLVYSAISNFNKTPVRAILRAGLGAAMVARGASGNCPLYSSFRVDGTKASSVNMQTTFVVNKPREEVYAAWRNLSQLPRFMKHLKNVTEVSSTRSHWEASISENAPVSISWDAEIVKDEPGALLAWRSLPGATIHNAGKVEFRDALGHQGTELRVTIVYRPPAGNLGTGVAKLLNPLFKKLVKEDVLNFKQYIDVANHQRVNGAV
jgi:uncharacterized membrane protein